MPYIFLHFCCIMNPFSFQIVKVCFGFSTASMLSLCFLFSAFNVAYPVEYTGAEIRKFIDDIEEKLPDNDQSESEKEVNDFDDSLIHGSSSLSTHGTECKSGLHKVAYSYFAFKEYPSDVASPPPDVS